MKLAALLALAVSSTAYAGLCEDACPEHEIANLEARAQAKDAAGARTFTIFLRDTVEDIRTSQPKNAVRLTDACRKILDVVPDDDDCVDVLARLRVESVGTHDVVAALDRRALRLTDRTTIEDLAAIHSSRAAPFVIAKWQSLESALAKKTLDTDTANEWAAWRGLAAKALAAGGTEARVFLADEIAQAHLDRGVKHACQDALAAVDKRLKP